MDIDCTDGQKRTPLMWAASAGDDICIFNLGNLRTMKTEYSVI